MMRIVRFRGIPWRRLLAAGVVVLALSAGLARGAGAATRFVATSGTDSSNTCLASGSPCKTITHALTQAVANDTISVAAGTYNLALGETFPLTINTNLTLTGAGAGSTILDATGANQRVITINSGVAAAISGVTASISGVTITGGTASCSGSCGAFGGGLFLASPNDNGSILTLTNSTVSGNTVSCIASGSGSCGAEGGGLFNDDGSTLTLTNSTVSGNTVSCTNSGSGHCYAGGGGLHNYGTLTLTNSTVSGNAASCTNNSGSGSCSAPGGGLGNSGGTLTVTASTVSGNTVQMTIAAASPGCGECYGVGGGLFNAGTLTLTNSTVSGNAASCTNNSGSSPTCHAGGGGIFNEGGSSIPTNATLTNSTLSGNTASCNNSGSGSCDAFGGGISNGFFGSALMVLTNATVSANTVACSGTGCTALGGGLGNFSGGTTTLKNTIVAKQLAGADCVNSATLTSNGFDLDSDNTCHLTQPSDKPNVSTPLLGPLANNGGPTQTHALLPGSPAIDAVTSGCPPPTTDQRGVVRPQGAACDIGAFELAVSVSPGHAGDALIFPLWDVNNLNTLIAVENLSAGTQVDRARFRDDMGTNVLEFALCLPGHSTWTAAIFRDGSVTRVVSESTLLVNGSSTPLNATLAGNPTRGYIEVIGLRSSSDPGVCDNPAIGADVPNSALMGKAYYVNPLQSPILAYGANALALKDFASGKITDSTVFGSSAVAQAMLFQGVSGSRVGSRYFVDPAFGAVTQVVLTFPTGPASGGCPTCRVPSSLTFSPATEAGSALTPFSRSTSGKLVNVVTVTSLDVASPSGFLTAADASGPASLPVTGFVVQTNTLLSPIFNVLFSLSIE